MDESERKNGREPFFMGDVEVKHVERKDVVVKVGLSCGHLLLHLQVVITLKRMWPADVRCLECLFDK